MLHFLLQHFFLHFQDDDDDELEEVAAAPKVLATPPQPLPRSFVKGAQTKTSTPKPPSPKPWRRTGQYEFIVKALNIT